MVERKTFRKNRREDEVGDGKFGRSLIWIVDTSPPAFYRFLQEIS
jgi:hypothetical protein